MTSSIISISEEIAADEEGILQIEEQLEQFIGGLRKNVAECEAVEANLKKSWSGPAYEAYIGRLNADLDKVNSIIKYIDANICPMQKQANKEYKNANIKAADLFKQV